MNLTKKISRKPSLIVIRDFQRDTEFFSHIIDVGKSRDNHYRFAVYNITFDVRR